MEKKDLTKENLIDFLHSEDSSIRKTAFEYCVGQILTHPAPIVSIVELLQNSNRISKEDQCKAIKNKTQSLQEYRHSRFFDLVYGSPYEVNAIANVLLTSKEIRLDKLCLRRLNNIKGSPEEENFIVFVLFCRAIENSYFEKQLGLRMKHGFNQLTDWRNLTDQMINFKDTPEIIRLKLVLADLLTHSMNIDNFKNLYCFLTKFALQTKDLAIKALKHFNQIGPWSSDNTNQIVSLMNTKQWAPRIFKIKSSRFCCRLLP